MMQLSELIKVLGADIKVDGDMQKDILGLAYDSRKVDNGYIFVAIPGVNFDGHDYIDQAITAGAEAIICEREVDTGGKPRIIVPDSRLALAALSAAFYNYPDRRLRLIGVTGTNGKTTTTHLIKGLLEAAGHKVGLVGTINNLAGDKVLPATHTTPESLELFALFAMMEEEGCDYIVIEASSHALAQGRVSSCNFVGGVFTNLTQDHLDYHGDIESYCQSKAKLFRQLDPTANDNRYGVVNAEDPHGNVFIDASNVPVWAYGGNKTKTTLELLKYSSSPKGMHFTIDYQGKDHDAFVPLIGKFNIYNSMAAICVALAEGLDMDVIIKALATAPQVSGRFEIVDAGQDFILVVDYAHTPDGLKNVLMAAAKLDPRRLISVFGCGGDRDIGKRPIMGRIGGAISDLAIVSSDNPRSEDPLAIIADVEAGVKEVGNNYLVEPDRKKAVQLAVNMAEPGDMIVLAGKGHETYQVIGTEVLHYDERQVAREMIEARLAAK